MQISAGYKRELELVAEREVVSQGVLGNENKNIEKQDFIDKLLLWFEKEDSGAQLMIAYGFCVFAFLYIFLHILKAFVF